LKSLLYFLVTMTQSQPSLWAEVNDLPRASDWLKSKALIAKGAKEFAKDAKEGPTAMPRARNEVENFADLLYAFVTLSHT
jgi:hypothetical protein